MYLFAIEYNISLFNNKLCLNSLNSLISFGHGKLFLGELGSEMMHSADGFLLGAELSSAKLTTLVELGGG